MRTWEIHPALVHFPIAFLIGGVVLDLFGRSSETAVATATYLLIAGLATGAIAAVAGVVAYYTVPGNHTAEAHQRVYWHIWTIVTAVVLFTVVCFVRWQHPSVVSPLIRGLGLVAVAIMVSAPISAASSSTTAAWASIRRSSNPDCDPWLRRTTSRPARRPGNDKALRQARRALRRRERRAATRGDGVASSIHPSRASPAVYSMEPEPS